MSVVVYSVENEMTSPIFSRAFAKGCGGRFTKRDELEPGDVALFGSPQRWRLLQQARSEGRTWFYGDHAYFGRRTFFRITKNAFQHDCRGELDLKRRKRFDEFRIEVQPWRTKGRVILICPNSPGFFALHGMDCQRWVEHMRTVIQQHTSRPIRVRYKHDPRPFEEDLATAWAVVCFVSVCGVHAALAGVPSFATGVCASQVFGTGDLSRIENPVRPDNRLELARVLAANQWSMHEIETGEAWAWVQ